jgi:hypothetical protein
MPITSEQISVVVQGPVFGKGVTAKCLTSIRSHLPDAHVILSTWVGSDVTGLDFDTLVLSEDPGGIAHRNPDAPMNNVNRQIVSTRAGIDAAQRPYALKFRSDFFLNSSSFLKWFGEFPKVEESCKLFSQKILACCYFTANPRGRTKYAYHLSDLIYFGLHADLKLLFEIPLMPADDAYKFPLAPEQYIFTQALAQAGLTFPLTYGGDASDDERVYTERYFASNTILLSFEQFGVRGAKSIFDKEIFPPSFERCITHVEWRRLYESYVDQASTAPLIDLERAEIRKNIARWRFVKVFVNVLSAPVLWSKPLKRRLRLHLFEALMRFTRTVVPPTRPCAIRARARAA